jgi:hypothetical protein
VLPVVLVLMGLAALAWLLQRLPLSLRQAQAVRQMEQVRVDAAAQSGLDWAWALVQGSAPLGEDCHAAGGGAGRPPSARDRWWTPAPDGRPRTRGRDAACALLATGWRCHCPAEGPARADPAGAALDPPAPGFRVRFAGPGADGLPRLQVDACLPWRDGCEAGPPTGVGPGPAATPPAPPSGAQARMTLAWHGGAHGPPPPAALIAVGDVWLGDSVRVVGPVTGEPVVVAGGLIARAPGAQVVGAPGGLGDDALSPRRRDWQDDALAAVPSAARRLAFAALGADLPLAGRGPAVHRPPCAAGGTCRAEALRAAWADEGRVWLWADGDLRIEGDADLGDGQRPVGLVVTGRLSWRGSGRFQGLVLSGQDALLQADGAPLRLDGALLARGGVHLTGPVVLNHHPATWQRWRWLARPWIPRPGTWSDLPPTP